MRVRAPPVLDCCHCLHFYLILICVLVRERERCARGWTAALDGDDDGVDDIEARATSTPDGRSGFNAPSRLNSSRCVRLCLSAIQPGARGLRNLSAHTHRKPSSQRTTATTTHNKCNTCVLAVVCAGTTTFSTPRSHTLTHTHHSHFCVCRMSRSTVVSARPQSTSCVCVIIPLCIVAHFIIILTHHRRPQ